MCGGANCSWWKPGNIRKGRNWVPHLQAHYLRTSHEGPTSWSFHHVPTAPPWGPSPHTWTMGKSHLKHGTSFLWDIWIPIHSLFTHPGGQNKITPFLRHSWIPVNEHDSLCDLSTELLFRFFLALHLAHFINVYNYLTLFWDYEGLEGMRSLFL